MKKSIVDTIYAAQKYAQEITKVTETHKAFSVEEAYGYQRELIDRYLREGSKVSGYKMGLTSREKMVQMGVNAPIYGVLLEEMDLKGSPLAVKSLLHPKAEPEIAVLLKADVTPDASIEEMEKAIGWIAPAIEIIDSRYKDFKFTMPDVVADNCSSAKYEIGEWLPYPIKGVHINEITVKLLINGELKAEGPATAVLGSPLLSLREQQLSLAKAGTQLKKGQLILTGAITVAMMLAPGDLVRVDTNHLGSVSIQCE